MRKTFAVIGFLLSLSFFIASGFGLTIEQITNNSVDDYNQLLNNHGQFVWTNDHPSDDQKNLIFLYDSFHTNQLSDAGDKYEAIDMNEKGQVVWAGWDGNDFEIYRYENGTTEMITQNNYDDLYPLINENGTIGYLGNGLYLYENGNAQLISDDVYDYSRKFDLNENNTVVWRSSSSGVFIYDGSISKEISVQGMCLSPQINASNQAVWSAMIFGRTLELYFYDGKETKLISTNAWDNSSFSMNANGQVVWRSVWGTSEIYLYENERTTLLNASCLYASPPMINDEGQIVWMTDSGIYLSDGNAVDLLFGMSNKKTRSLHITNNGQVIWDAAPIDGDGNFGELYLFDGTDVVKVSASAHFGFTGADARIADNGQIVWNEWDGNDTEIFMAYQDDANNDGIPDAVQKGMLRVIIGPEEAVSGGARWRVNNGAWQDSGTRLTGLAVGEHVVEFNEISGWNEPQSQSIVIVEGRTAELEANYQKAGSLQVTIRPQEAVDSGAQWRIDEGEWHDSGETVYNLLAGNHSLAFREINGWTAPPVQNVTVEQNRTVTVSRTYEEIRKTGSLQVTITPQDLVADGRWRINGGAWNRSGFILSPLAVGEYTVEFNLVEGWSKPAPETITIMADQNTAVTGTYSQIIESGALRVTILPEEAVAAGARWRIDDSPWLENGETVGGLSVGRYTLSCLKINGWETPSEQTVSIAAEETDEIVLIYKEVSESHDSDGDGVPDSLDGYPDDGAIVTLLCANGKNETIEIDVSGTAACSLYDAFSCKEDNARLNQANRPDFCKFPYGVISYKVKGLKPGETVSIKTVWPSVPEENTYFRVGADGFYEFTDYKITGNVISMTLTDGGAGDHDGMVNGEIHDAGGLAIKNVSSDTGDDAGGPGGDDPEAGNEGSGGGGGGGCFIGSL